MHVSVVHWTLSLQLSGGVVARQMPTVHCSTPLHTLLSVHDWPSLTARFRHPRVASQESAVQVLVSLQFCVLQKFEQPSQLTVFPA